MKICVFAFMLDVQCNNYYKICVENAVVLKIHILKINRIIYNLIITGM